MQHADFIHLVRLSEQASAEDSRAYRRGVAIFAALGYFWVLACLALALGLIGWTLGAWGSGRWSGGRVWALLAGLGLLWSTLHALWVRIEPPEGARLQPADAPALFDALARIRRRIGGPPIHAVYLNDEFNASIRQWPRFGLLGGAVNTLSIGLPLLMALDHRRVLAVLAHEYGHLRGGHGRLSAWIYRTRLAWLRMDASLQREQGPLAVVSQAFLRWYFPRFAARTFALARQDEYEADRISARLLGRRTAGAALVEIAVKSEWHAQELLAAHWARAAQEEHPRGPFASWRVQLGGVPPAEFAGAALRRALARLSDASDTHPGLRDRLDALEARARLPEWSARSSLDWLADVVHWVAHFDNQWCRQNAADWRQHHAELVRVRLRVEELASAAGRLNADECVQWAELALRLEPRAEVAARYQRALVLSPDHPGALRGLVQALPATDRAGRLPLLERLHASAAGFRWWAAQTAVTLLEDPKAGPHDDAGLKLWRQRLRSAQEAEQRAWEELSEAPHLARIAPHDLSEYELGELRFALARCHPVARAWLLRKNLREFGWRRAYLLFLELPDLADEDRYALCRELERHLPLPGMALALWAGEEPTLRDIEQHARAPVWVRSLR